MATLPTFEVTATTAQRIQDAFSGQVDATGATLPPMEAYKRWLRAALVSLVTAREAEAEAVVKAEAFAKELP